MKIVRCEVCNYQKISSLEDERECKYCGGLLRIIADEEKNENN